MVKGVSKNSLQEILGIASETVFGKDSAKGACKDKICGFASDSLIFDSPEKISTGCDLMDYYLKGGIPLSRLTEIFGDPNKGKSTILASIYSSIQKMGGLAVHLLSEPEFDSGRWIRMGVKVDELMVVPIDIIEIGFQAIRNIARKSGELGIPSVIGWDTLDGALTKNEYDSFENPKAEWSSGMMDKFKKIRRELGRIKHELPRNKCGLIIVQQSIANPMPYSKTESGGGGGIKFYSDLRLYLSGGKSVKLPDGRIGLKTNIEIRKSKVCPPYRKFPIIIDPENGIDNDITNYDFLVDNKNDLIKESKGWYSIGGSSKVRWSEYKKVLQENEGLRNTIKLQMEQYIV